MLCELELDKIPYLMWRLKYEIGDGEWWFICLQENAKVENRSNKVNILIQVAFEC